MRDVLATAVGLVRDGQYVSAAALLGSLRVRVAGDEVYDRAVEQALVELSAKRAELAMALLETLGRLCVLEDAPLPRLTLLSAGGGRRRSSGSFQALNAHPHVDQ